MYRYVFIDCCLLNVQLEIVHVYSRREHFTGANSGADTVYTPEHLSLSPVLSGVRVAKSFLSGALYNVVSSFVLFLLTLLLFVLRFTDSHYPFWYLQALPMIFALRVIFCGQHIIPS